MNTLSVENYHNPLMGEIYRKNYKNVYYQVLSIVKNRETAYDLTQDIFLKVIEQLATFKGKSSLSTWLYVVARNHSLEYLRKTKHSLREITCSDCQIAASEYDPEEEIIKEGRKDWIEEVLSDQNNTETNILFLKYKMKMSVKEIQDHLNLSESAVKMRLQRARKHIANSYYSSKSAA